MSTMTLLSAETTPRFGPPTASLLNALHDALLGERDRSCLDRADPDRQVALTLDLSEQDDGIVGGHLHSDANYLESSHR